MADKAPPVLVNRAPVLTLWATVVAERLGHPADTAATLGRSVAGSSARIKARSLGIADDNDDGKDHKETKTQRETKETVRLLGRDIPVAKAKGGALVAAADGRSPPSPAAARSYVERAFGERLAEVRAAMEELATSLDPEELNRIGFRLYERFRPEIPAGARGWGAKGELYLDRIRDAADPG